MNEPTEAAATACAAGGSKSEEEALLEAIAEQRRLVDAMPSDTLTDICERAPHEKKLGQLEFRHHLPLEKYRISSVLATFEEEHGSLYKEPCLLCLDDVYLHADLVISHRFMCCGGFTCKRCADDFRKTKPTQCPLCREPLRESSAELLLQLMVFVEKGASWAETMLGTGMMHGYFGIKKQERTGLEWINKAVAKDYPAAIFELFNFRSSALTSLSSTMAHEECNNLLLKAANLGHGQANSRLAMRYLGGDNGFEKDRVKGYFRASVAFALDGTDYSAAQMLGLMYLHGSELLEESKFSQESEFLDLEASPYLACYYMNIAANVVDVYGGQYSNALFSLDKHLHNGDYCEVPGYNVLPAVFFWASKYRDSDMNKGCKMELEVPKEIEKLGQRFCSSCGREAQADEKFKQCSRCKAQWYCSKECQVEAWKAGHNKDCKRVGILNFEDYLNSF
ncbi:hypothetical protein THAOC_36627 [Thalassiosira oceanica]|uniref:MYND-type domain-containing protein n=1 Tax=Thalassiosira oceanica TaxID=159749 RepID=K0R1K9_THAOC|nr:hypothetical protein THAOC_36627 [Thalassiosira oceanica]|eukprot:EJK44804.1 hypothetical protein THAOC_36627 [Thalassiosira oceanica]